MSTMSTRRTVLRASSSVLAASVFPDFASSQQAMVPRLQTVRSQFIHLEPPADVSGVVLRGPKGRTRSIGRPKNKSILVSLWASWCPPCRRELPILHRLQARSGQDSAFEVLAIALDRDPATAVDFLDRLGLSSFQTFVDPAGDVARAPAPASLPPFPLYGMPMSYIVDHRGRNVGYLTGEADWSAPDAQALLRYYSTS